MQEVNSIDSVTEDAKRSRLNHYEKYHDSPDVDAARGFRTDRGFGNCSTGGLKNLAIGFLRPPAADWRGAHRVAQVSQSFARSSPK